MTDEQFDDLCRDVLDFDPGPAKLGALSLARAKRWSWLPSVPEILVCGCACGLALVAVSARLRPSPSIPLNSSAVVERAMKGSLSGLQVSAVQIPDSTRWTETSIGIPTFGSSDVKDWSTSVGTSKPN